jgi:hypothetical protein
MQRCHRGHDDSIERPPPSVTPHAVTGLIEDTPRERKRFRYTYCVAMKRVRRNDVAMVQVALVIVFGFSALLAMLFVALVAGVASADRARVPVTERRPTDMRR